MIGATLGSYKIVSEIGSGGMGVVYLAEHTLLGRKAAVKLLRADMPSEYVERFFNEAKAAATLHHPGLVDVFDFGHHSDGSAFIVMEFLHGESLAQRLERDPKLPVPLALVIARSVAMALHVAHDQGIIHRDLKPGNIFLLADPEAPAGIRTKVLDFGIAKLVRDRDARSVKTQSGAVIGTPRYMSPEQCKNARSVDGRSDIYALGCILYEMLVGVAPFDYDNWAELVGAHIYEVPAKIVEIDANIAADVETLVTKMLEKSPEDRFPGMQELSQSIEVLIRKYGGDNGRISSNSLTRITPAGGVKKRESADDPTLPGPQSGDRTPSTPPRLPAASQPAADAPPSTPPRAISQSDGTPSTPSPRRSSQSGDTTPSTPPRTPPRPGSASGSPALADTHQQTLPDVAPRVTPAPSVTAETSAATTAPVTPVRKVPWLGIAIGVGGLAALGVAAMLVLNNKDKEQTEPVYAVLEPRGSADEPAGAKAVDEATDTPGAAVALEPEPDPVPTPTRNTGSAAKKPPVPKETDVNALTRTFGKQSGAITACFKKHGQPTAGGEIQVRIQIDATGHVVAAGMLPDSIEQSPLGACIVAIAKKTSFGPQPKGATFRVPLLTNGR